jgi:hypothetical protein
MRSPSRSITSSDSGSDSDSSRSEGEEEDKALHQAERTLAKVKSLHAKASKKTILYTGKGYPLVDLDEDQDLFIQVVKDLAKSTLDEGTEVERLQAVGAHLKVGQEAWRKVRMNARHQIDFAEKVVSFAQTHAEVAKTMATCAKRTLKAVRANARNNRWLVDELRELKAQRATDAAARVVAELAYCKLAETTAQKERETRLKVIENQLVAETRFGKVETYLFPQETRQRLSPALASPSGEFPPTIPPIRPAAATQAMEVDGAPQGVIWGSRNPAPTPAVEEEPSDSRLEAAISQLRRVMPPKIYAAMTYKEIEQSAQNMLKDWPMAEVARSEVSTKSGGYRVPPPGKFSGEDPKVDVDDMMFIYHTYLNELGVPKEKWSTVAMNLLQGRALTQYTEFAKALHPVLPTWKQFTGVMAQFALPNKRITAIQALMSIKQTSSVLAYVQKFKSLLSQSGDPPSKTEQVVYLWSGLNEAAKQTSRTDVNGLFWTDPDALMTHLCNVELSAALTKPKYTLPTPVVTNSRYIKAVHTLPDPSIPQGQRKAPKTSGEGRPNSGSREERERYKHDGSKKKYEGHKNDNKQPRHGYHGGGNNRDRGGYQSGSRANQSEPPCTYCLDKGMPEPYSHANCDHKGYLAGKQSKA